MTHIIGINIGINMGINMDMKWIPSHGGMMMREKNYIISRNTSHLPTHMTYHSRKINNKYIRLGKAMIMSTLTVTAPSTMRIRKFETNLYSEVELWMTNSYLLFCMNYDLIFTNFFELKLLFFNQTTIYLKF